MQSKSLINQYEAEEGYKDGVSALAEDGGYPKETSGFALFSNRLAIRIVLFASSLILLLLSVFAPMAYSEAVIDDGAELKMGFTTVDYVKVAVYSFFSMNVKQLEETDEYKAFEDYRARFESGLVSYGDKDETEEALHNYLFFSVMQNSYTPKAGMIVSAVASAVYVAVCFVLFVFACVALVCELRKKNKSAKNSARALNRASVMTWFAFLILPAISYTSLQTCHFGVGGEFSMLSENGVGIGLGFIASFAIALFASVFLAVNYILKTASSSEKRNKNAIRKNVLALIFSAVFAVSLFLPCVSVGYAMKENDAVMSTSLSFGINDVYEFSINDVNSYMNHSYTNGYSAVLDVVKQSFSYYGDEGELAFKTVNRVVMSNARNDISALYVVVFFVFLAMLVFFALTVLGILKRLILNQNFTRGHMLMAIFQLVCSVIYLALIIVVCAVSNTSFPLVLSIDLIFNIGIGPIICLLSSVAVIFFVRRDNMTCSDIGGYDNADVSFAPYVVGC